MTVILKYAFPKQAMEMTEYGKGGNPSRLSTLPTLFGNRFGLPHSPGLDRLRISKRNSEERPEFKAFTPQEVRLRAGRPPLDFP
jgi:hypothetical protein